MGETDRGCLSSQLYAIIAVGLFCGCAATLCGTGACPDSKLYPQLETLNPHSLTQIADAGD